MLEFHLISIPRSSSDWVRIYIEKLGHYFTSPDTLFSQIQIHILSSFGTFLTSSKHLTLFKTGLTKFNSSKFSRIIQAFLVWPVYDHGMTFWWHFRIFKNVNFGLSNHRNMYMIFSDFFLSRPSNDLDFDKLDLEYRFSDLKYLDIHCFWFFCWSFSLGP